jgi:hypothetical protein
MRHYALPAPAADPRPAIEASLGFLDLAPAEVSVPLWLAMYAAPLHPFKSLNTMLWIYGASQSGKSTYAHLALAHFGAGFIEGRDYRAPRDWTSTVTDLEGALFKTKDIPCLIDDYAPQQVGAGEARALRGKAHYLIRSVGNRTSRGRARADLSEQNQRPPRGLVIATAELPISGHSDVGRLIVVPVEHGQIIQTGELEAAGEATALDRAQADAQAGLYAQAMAGYISWLAGHWDKLAKIIPGRLEKEVQQGRAMFSSEQSRLVDYYALLAVADFITMIYFGKAGALSDSETADMHKAHKAALAKLLHNQSERISTQSPALKFCQALEDLLAQGKIYLAKRDEPSIDEQKKAELVGWYGLHRTRENGVIIERERLFLLTAPCLAQIREYWRHIGDHFDTAPDAIRRQMWQVGFIERPKSETRYEQRIWMTALGKQVRVMVVDPAKVKAVTEIELINTEEEEEIKKHEEADS